MSEMVERAARAIALYDGTDWNGVIGGREICRERYRKQARAVMEAMRNPTDEQRNAYYELSHRTETMFDAHWERAIDAALR